MARSDFFTKDKFIKGKPSFVETIGDYDVYLIKVKRRQYCPIEMSYYRCVIDGHEDWYVTLQHGKEAKAANFSHSVFSDIKQAREHIRYIVANKRIILTNEEWDKWVSKPNKANEWGFTKNQLTTLLADYKKADARRKAGYLERLEDANFHTFHSLLESGDYDKTREWIENDF